MPLESVFFGVDNDRIEYQYDRSKLRLGGRVFVVSDAAGRDASAIRALRDLCFGPTIPG